MGDRAVVALEEVLAGDLPVRLHVELAAEAEDERVDVEDVGDAGGDVSERLCERRGVGVGIDEDEWAPGPDRDLAQAELSEVETGLAVGPRRGTKRAVEAVRPGVVGALKGLASPRPACEDVAPVAADVEEGPEDAVARACNYNRNLPRDGREVRAVLHDLP